MKKFLKKFLMAAALVGGFASTVHADAAWVDVTNVGLNKKNSGVTVKRVTLVSGTNVLSQALPVDCDANGEVYIKASASTNDSSTISVGPSTATSFTLAGPTTLTTTISRTALTASQQCYVWAKLTPIAGSTATLTVEVQTEDTQRRNRPGL